MLINKSLTPVCIVRYTDSPRGNVHHFVDLFTGLIVSNRYKYGISLLVTDILPGLGCVDLNFFISAMYSGQRRLYFIRSNANKGFLMLLQLEDGDSSLISLKTQ